MTYQKTKKAYKEIMDLIKYHRDLICFPINDLEEKANHHLFGIELKEKYGLDVEPKDIRSMDYFRIDDYRFIGWYGEKYRRTIAWEDDGKQVEDELLLSIRFSTGAYIFDRDYPTDLFNEFWQELKCYKPKYVDTVNHTMYFSLDNAKDIFNNFKDIYKKYCEKNKEDSKLRQIAKLQKELEVLESKK